MSQPSSPCLRCDRPLALEPDGTARVFCERCLVAAAPGELAALVDATFLRPAHRDGRFLEPGLVRGGQGRTARDVLESASALRGMFIGIVLGAAIWAALSALGKVSGLL